MITIKNLKVTYGKGSLREKKALRGVDLKMSAGEFITVIGSNGAGKSTLLNAIAGESKATGGSIHIDHVNVTKDPSYKRASMVARVFQDPLAGTCADLSIAENLALAERRGDRRGLSLALSKGKREEYTTLLNRLNLGLEHRLDTFMGALSGGQRQALSLLMATLSPLKILLLDEHTSALDPKTAAFVMNLTEEIVKEKQLTSLMVTHSLNQALQTGTRTIMLHEGKIIFDVKGDERKNLTPQDLLSKFGTSVDDDRLLLRGQ